MEAVAATGRAYSKRRPQSQVEWDAGEWREKRWWCCVEERGGRKRRGEGWGFIKNAAVGSRPGIHSN